MLVSLSLGAGVQSSTVALMAERGEITPMPDFAIFADTGAEPKHIYDWLTWLEGQLSFPVYRVMHKQGLTQAIEATMTHSGRFGSPPFFTTSASGGGMLRRQCTRDYKVEPIEKKLRMLAGLKPGQHAPKDLHIEQWIGISLDEIQRMKEAKPKWLHNRWPLIEERMTRLHCLEWMRDNGFNELPKKSACTYCPYHDNSTWREMKGSDPESWAEACRVDELIRDGFPHTTEKLFLHRSLMPLAAADLTDPAVDQIEFGFMDECDGMCGL